MKSDMNTKHVLFNFVQPVVAIWHKHESVRWEWHCHNYRNAINQSITITKFKTLGNVCSLMWIQNSKVERMRA
jgi:hypothetical protein